MNREQHCILLSRESTLLHKYPVQKKVICLMKLGKERRDEPPAALLLPPLNAPQETHTGFSVVLRAWQRRSSTDTE
ncbi:hypothetical protein Y032_0033g2732 [Ancylostoma ceylanicum]|uniref:Uncharacterized protein n=1 Tax=Ancylostoma ceylanicum TaxID=53326 RepID=A0A016UN45_9BILA|nr:hypothetical protein Y032_0033g2732 [Ancylostoma ceylanicum]